MTLTELKRELSQLSGEDFFNPKYRDVFKKYAGEDLTEAEAEKMEEMGIPVDEQPDEVVEAREDKQAEENAEEAQEEVKDVPTDAEQIEAKEEDIDKAEDEREIDKIEEDKAEEPAKEEEKAEEVKEESDEIGKEVDELKDDEIADELLDTKIELELVKGGVRDDKLEPAKRMAKFEIQSLDDLDKVKELLAMYPEWLKSYKAEKFGMPVDEDVNNLTAEEKRLKQLGIDL